MKEIIKKYKTPNDELSEYFENVENAQIIDIEDQLDEIVEFENLAPEEAERMLTWFVRKRVIEYRKGTRKPEEHVREFIAICEKEGVKTMYNMMTHREEIIFKKYTHNEVLGKAEEQRIYRLEDIVKKYKFPTKSVMKYLTLSAVPYHPVYEWINSKEWDGVDRFEDMFNALDVKNENQDLAKVYFWKWCLAGCRAILTQEGFVSENILILKAVQGAGKTKFLYKLAPKGCVKTGIQLNPSNKDSVLEATSVWIAELGELDGTTSKSDTASLKAFFSKNIDYIRKPYGRAEELIPRKTIFCGSVNSDTFLVDDTGNRRYWVLEIGESDHKHKIDAQQFWRQVMNTALLDKEEHPHWLTKEEAKAQALESKKFKDLPPLCQKILKIENQLTDEKYSTQEIASFIDYENLKPHESKVIKQFMISELGWSLEMRGGRQYWLINPNVYVPSEVNEEIF